MTSPGPVLASRLRRVISKYASSRAVRDVSALTIANLGVAVVGLLQTVIVARVLGPEGYGLAALIMAYPDLVHTFLDARSAQVLVRYLTPYRAQSDSERFLAVCWVGIAFDSAITIVCLVVIVATAPFAAFWLVKDSSVSSLLIVYSLAFLPGALSGTASAILSSHARFQLTAGFDLSMRVSRTVVVTTVVLSGAGVAGLIVANAVMSAISGTLFAVIAITVVRRECRGPLFDTSTAVLGTERREILRFLIYNDISVAISMVPKQCDVLILGWFSSAASVGAYKLARLAATMVGYIVSPLQAVFYTKLAGLRATDPDEIRTVCLRWTVTIGIPLGVALLVFSALLPYVIPYIAGHAYAPAVVPTVILLAGCSVWLALFGLRPLYMCEGRVTEWARLNSVLSVVALAAFVTITPRFGVTGLAISSAVVQVIGLLTATLLLIPSHRWFALLSQYWTFRRATEVDGDDCR